MLGTGIAIGVCFLFLTCSIATSYYFNFVLYNPFGTADGAGTLSIAAVGILCPPVSGLVTGLLVVFTILPKPKPTPKYHLVLYGLFIVCIPVLFFIIFVIILNIGKYLAG